MYDDLPRTGATPGGPQEAAERPRGCPISHTDYTRSTPIYGHYADLDAEREANRFYWNDTTPRGFWMLTRYDDVQQGLQRAGDFTTKVTSALSPDRAIPLLPQDLNGPEHAKMRRVINPFFAPAAVRRLEDLATQRCIELIDEVKDKGSCDFVSEFAIRYPTDLFLALLGLPVSDGDFFLPWVESVFAGFFGGDPDETKAAADNIMEYFDQAVTDRRANPKDPALDMVSRLVLAEVDEEPLDHQDILTVCMTLMLAGLDTTRSALGFIFAHLANNPADRQILIDDPSTIAAAIEEFVRMNPLVIQVGRQVEQDTIFHGLPMEAGQVVWFGLGSANRDPRKYPDPEKFELGRRGVNQHLGFGAGPHRCLGLHLARVELAIVLREWHERIPNYRIKSDTELIERGGQLTLDALPLEWDV
jgi:cytochrome P450